MPWGLLVSGEKDEMKRFLSGLGLPSGKELVGPVKTTLNELMETAFAASSLLPRRSTVTNSRVVALTEATKASFPPGTFLPMRVLFGMWAESVSPAA